MSSQFETDAAAFEDDYFAIYGTAVTLRRGQQSQQMTAIAEADSWEVQTDEGGTIEFVTRNYMIRAGEFALGGAATEPQRGDIIEETIAGQAKQFELLTDQGRACWSRCGPGGSVFYLRTKEV